MSTVLIGGGSGLIGTRLSQLLTQREYTVWHLSRHPDSEDIFPTYHWDAKRQQIDQEAVDKADYVINLAGAGIADQRWTEERKQVIIDSRVNTTRLLRDSFARSASPPKAFVSASAVGYYGDRGDQVLMEADPPGDGFLSKSCRLWEASVQEVAELGIRTAMVRTGIVLSTQGGALPKMMLPLKAFAGTYFGDGKQWYSWIHIDDLCRIYIHLLENEALAGPYNGAAPHPVTNYTFVKKVAEAMGKPAAMIPAPAFALRLAMGEMSHAVLDSVRASADKIQQADFDFHYPEVLPALKNVLERKI